MLLINDGFSTLRHTVVSCTYIWTSNAVIDVTPVEITAVQRKLFLSASVRDQITATL